MCMCVYVCAYVRMGMFCVHVCLGVYVQVCMCVITYGCVSHTVVSSLDIYVSRAGF